ncbi:hypothetical protein [Bauldia litoralis]|uniref:Uncharacterized protein n=1 Tax=Bauldia litoralis TaxID=665467 RepID=A0A1G6AZD3_9HYPH|nr:hypothetical protein [Bauldia litoralis]SDB13613.1 hypothetical protein SAMN02982931_01025 [Bauldia litoralis]
MTPAKKAFRWVFGICLGLGVLLGLVKLVAPDAASVTWNGAEMTGLGAIAVAGGIGAFFGLIFGLIIAGIVKLATRGSAKA